MQNRFKIQEQIGHGAYSVVLRAIDLVNHTQVAIKKINHCASELKMVLHRQIRILQRLNHPNIIKLITVYRDSQFTYLVFEYLPFDLISYYKDIKQKKHRNLNDGEITFIAHQCAQALAYMHGLGIMHRDIKPENILVNPKTLQIKLIDFGFATESHIYGKNTQYMVTRWYRPLEIVLGLPYDYKADIFSFGALMLELYHGEEIFRSSSNIDQLYWIIEVCGFPSWAPALDRMKDMNILAKPTKEPAIRNLTRKVREEGKNLIFGMLQTNPLSRLSIGEILAHPYFSRFNQIVHNQYGAFPILHEERNPKIQMRIPLQHFQQNSFRGNYQPALTDRTKNTNYQSQPHLIDTFRRLSYNGVNNKEPESLNIEKRNTRMMTFCPSIKTERGQEVLRQNLNVQYHASVEKVRVSAGIDRKSSQSGLKLISLRKNHVKTQKSLQKGNIQPEDRQCSAPARKGPVFSKIRGKVVTNNKIGQRPKISLTERPGMDRKNANRM